MPNCWWFFVAVAIAIGATPCAAGERVSLARRIGLKISPETTIIDGPLTVEGLPDYVVHLNSKLSRGVEPEDNFWALMWDVFGHSGRLTAEERATSERWLGVRIPAEGRLRIGLLDYSILDQVCRSPWTRDQFPDAANWVEANAEALATAARAAERSRAFAPLQTNRDEKYPPTCVHLPQLDSISEVGRLLAARSMLRLGEGDPEGAWRDLMTHFRIARHVEGGWCALDLLIAWNLRSQAGEALTSWISGADPSAEELEWRLTELKPLLATRPMAEIVEGEGLQFADAVISVASGTVAPEAVAEMGFRMVRPDLEQPPDSSPMRHAQGVIQQLENQLIRSHLMTYRSDCNAALRTGVETFTELREALSLPTHPARRERLIGIRSRLEKANERLAVPGAVIAEMLQSRSDHLGETAARYALHGPIESFVHLEVRQTRAEARSRILLAALRLKALLAAGAKRPSLWSDLNWDSGDVADPFSGEPLKLRSDERTIAIWSVGPNGTDDYDEAKPDAETDDIRTVLRLR
jgi:hypothetical protein